MINEISGYFGKYVRLDIRLTVGLIFTPAGLYTESDIRRTFS